MRNWGILLTRGRRGAWRSLALASAALLLAVLARPAAVASVDEAFGPRLSAQSAELDRFLGGGAPEQPPAVEAQTGADNKRPAADLPGLRLELAAATPGLGEARPCDDGPSRRPPRAVAARFATGPPEFSS